MNDLRGLKQIQICKRIPIKLYFILCLVILCAGCSNQSEGSIHKSRPVAVSAMPDKEAKSGGEKTIPDKPEKSSAPQNTPREEKPLAEEKPESTKTAVEKPLTESKGEDRLWETKSADLNGDGAVETISLIDSKTANGNYSADLRFVIRNGQTGEVLIEKKADFNGIFPGLFVGDMNNDGIADFRIGAGTGGNGYQQAYYSFYSFKGNKLTDIQVDSINENSNVKVNVTDSSVKILVDGIKQEFTPPLTKYQEVLNKKIQNKEEKYKDSTFGYFSGNSIVPVDVDNDGRYELKTSNILLAEYHSEIAIMDVVYKYSDSGWKPVSADMKAIHKVRTNGDRAKELKENELVFNNLRTGLTYDQVVQLMGKPAREERKTVAKDKVGISLTYSDGTYFYICPALANYISVSSNSYKTPRGLKIGDSRDRARELYGEPENYDSDRWSYYSDKLNHLDILFKDNKVADMTIECLNN